MRVASVMLMFAALAIAGSGALNIASMGHGGSHTGWCPVAVTAGDCPTATNALAAVVLHLDGMREFFTATAAGASAGSLLALLGFLVVPFTLIRSDPDRKPAVALRVLPRAAREPRSRRETRLARWIAFHENSPSFA